MQATNPLVACPFLRMNHMKIFFRRIHLYIAFGAGLIIMVTCLTGAMLVFEKELMQLFHKERYYTIAQKSRMPLDTLISRLKASEPKATISSVRVYSNPARTVEVSFTRKAANKKKEASVETRPVIKEKAKPAEGQRLVAFVDPYNGVVREIYNHRESFFYWVMDVHRWMLGGDTGKLVVGVCTLLFLVILITGIILWWPKNKQILKQRLKIKSDAGFKRLNHDYHIVLGFYSAVFLLVFAFTGLAWSFEWFNKGIYTITGSSMERPKPVKSTIKDSTGFIPVEQALQTVVKKTNNAVYYNLTFPKDSSETFAVNLLPANASHESASDSYFVDAYSGTLAGVQLYKDRNAGQRARATFKPVHVASIYGVPSKVIGLLACLLGTFFPASGFIMWCNGTRKIIKLHQ
jgi:uncharacterized iron-regulated membrane protein